MTKFEEIGAQIGKLVAEKNEAYGNSFADSSKVLAALYPNGVSTAQLPDMLVVVRIVDKLFRIANRKDAFGESPYRDIAGYGILGATQDGPEHVDQDAVDETVCTHSSFYYDWHEGESCKFCSFCGKHL